MGEEYQIDYEFNKNKFGVPLTNRTPVNLMNFNLKKYQFNKRNTYYGVL